MPRHVNDSWGDFLGPGALTSFLLCLLTIVAGLGLPILYRLRQILRESKAGQTRPADLILVLGRSLRKDRPTAVFQARLDWGAELLLSGVAPRLIVAGGLTGDATRTEAEAGRAYLVGRGMPPEVVACEDRSRHTLENLFNVRETMAEKGWSRLIIVSDALHLARVSALARGLSMSFVCSAAPGAAPTGGGFWVRAVKEAFFLHWYHVGVAYSRLIRSERLLSRVT